jgi:chromosome segregation ATPase
MKKKVDSDDLDKRLAYLMDHMPKSGDVQTPSKVIERQVGPEISQKMIDAWNENLKHTFELKGGFKLCSDKLEKHDHRLADLEKKIPDLASKSDMEKI